MLTSNKKLVVILISFILLFSIVSNKSIAIVRKTSNFYVNDVANVIDSSTEEYIINMNTQLYNKTGAQIVVVTVNSLDGLSIEDYALQLFRNYGIGSKEKNNGVLFLISVGDRQTRIEVGYGLEGRLTDGLTGRILDNYAIPSFKESKWNDGILNGFNAILSEVTDEYNITIDGASKATSAESSENILYVTGTAVCFICLILRHFFKSSSLFKWIVGLRNCNYCFHSGLSSFR